jgi:hypothetical protein
MAASYPLGWLFMPLFEPRMRWPRPVTGAARVCSTLCELGDQHRVAALHTNLADLLHADGQHDAAMTHPKEAARRFASVDVGDAPRPEIWTLVEW